MARDHLTFFTSLAVVFLFTMILCTEAHANTNTVSSNTVSSNTVDKAPPSAISPSISIVNSDLCRTGISGSVTSSVIGVSSGITIEDETCRLIKISRQLKALGLSVPAVSILAQDPEIFDSLWLSAVYPPINGEIGTKARDLWLLPENRHLVPEGSKVFAKIKIEEQPKQFSDKQNVALFKGLFLLTSGLLLF